MVVLLSILQIFSLPVLFLSAIAYFAALYKYKELLVEELPDVWNAARSKARPLESWMPTAYKLLQRNKIGTDEGSIELRALRKKAVLFLYIAAISFIVFLFASLLNEAV